MDESAHRHRSRSWLGAALLASSVAIPASADDAAVDFGAEVRPILARHCFLCHGPDASSRKAGLRLDVRDGAMAPTRGGAPPAVVPGAPDEGRLLARVSARDDDERMPPDGRQRLSEAEIAVLRRWIEQGAAYDAHWSWRDIREVTPPATGDRRWDRHPVDRFVRAVLARRGLDPAGPAAPSTLARRLSFDLTGLPPEPERVEALLASPPPDAWDAYVDELLASPHFAERWARHWLDLVRYAETHGHEFDYPIRHAWRYRDYVIRAIDADVPYDELVIEHLAGDLLDEPRRHPTEQYDESVIATGFWYLSQGTHAPVDVRGDEAERIANQIEVLGKAFLGLTVSCARCHDHKFDAITTEDFYALAGFMQSTRRDEAYLDPHGAIAEAARELEALATELGGHVAAALSSPEAAGGLAERLRAAAAAIRLVGPDAPEALASGSSSPVIGALLDARLKTPEHPLTAAAGRLLGEERDASAPDPRGRVFASFDEPGAWSCWFPSGVAFGTGPTGARDVIATGPGVRPAPPGAAFSGRLGDAFQGTLRSPTFEIDCDEIVYRLAGRGRVRLIIDGYFLDEYNALLFGGMTLDVDRPPIGWTSHRQDVGRYRGHRAYIELIDDAPDAALAVDEIRLAASPDGQAGVDAVGEDEDGDPAAEIAGLVAQALRRWPAGAATSDDVAVLDWALAHHLLPPRDPEAAGRVDEIVARARAVHERVPAPVRVLAVADGTPEDEYVFIRGDHRNAGPTAPRRFIASLSNDTTPIRRGSGRLELARRLMSPGNPLPSRVMVNRVWLHLFGEGIVPTPDDFGALGEPPTHPELLDWLAGWFRGEGGWSLKRLVRLLVTSETYRMSSRVADPLTAERLDPDNRLLHRRSVRRLDAEAIRDSILWVSGRLDPTLHGPPVPVHLTPFLDGRGRPGESGPLDGDGRRSIYLAVRRNFLPPMLTAFDAPVPATTIGRRHRSNVPAQALALLNDPFVVEQARLWARRELEIPGRTPAERIDAMHRRAYSRPAEKAEIDLAIGFLREQTARRGGGDWTHDEDAWADYAHVLLNAKELIFY